MKHLLLRGTSVSFEVSIGFLVVLGEIMIIRSLFHIDGTRMDIPMVQKLFVSLLNYCALRGALILAPNAWNYFMVTFMGNRVTFSPVILFTRPEK